MKPRLLTALLFASLSLGAALPAAKAFDYELSRAYQLLERGQENRAKVLFREYLKRHPDNVWALEGYEAAGGELSELRLPQPQAKKSAAKPKSAEAPSRGPVLDEAAAEPTEAERELEAHADAPAKHEASPQAESQADENAPQREGGVEDEEGEPAADEAVIAVELEPAGRPAWLTRLVERLKSAGWLALIGLGLLLGVALLLALAILGVRFSAWHERRRQAQLQALVGSPAANVYVEYRHWAPWWGFGLDGEAASNSVLQQFNAAGWQCLEARREWAGLLKLPLVQILLVILVQLLTLGFMRYYTGPTFLFKRVGAPQPAPAEA